MTAVIKVDLAAQYPNSAADFVLDDSDLVAAFSGETCLGVASPNEGLFYLYIGAPIGVTPTSVTLRYYSAHYKNLFEAKDAFPYVSDTQQGNADEPFIRLAQGGAETKKLAAFDLYGNRPFYIGKQIAVFISVSCNISSRHS